MTPDFETHETGTFAKLDVQAEKVRQLEREKRALMFFLGYDDAELERAVEMYEKTVFVPVPCARCGGPTPVEVNVEKSDKGELPVVTCGKCKK